MSSAIRLNSLQKTFGTHRAVDGLSFDVPSGSVFGLLGRNGAGKSTTIRMIMDIIRPDAGSVEIFGGPLTEASKDRVGYLPEERGLYPKMKIIDLLQFQGSLKGLSLSDAKREALLWLDRLELGAWSKKKVEELSKGMQQKVQFTAAVMHKPDLIILDEPFSGMDPVNQELFKRMISELSRGGTTIIFSTHVMASAEELCQSIALIDAGKAVLQGSLKEIRRTYGGNIVQLDFAGEANGLADIAGVKRVETTERGARLELDPDVTPQSILPAASQQTVLTRFEVEIPTLHNIFIKEVGGEVKDE